MRDERLLKKNIRKNLYGEKEKLDGPKSKAWSLDQKNMIFDAIIGAFPTRREVR